MRVDVLTLFPGFFHSPLETSILARAQRAGALGVHLTDIRAYTTDKHHKADDCPYGGGAGMVMKPEPIFAAVEDLPQTPGRRVVLTCPQGVPYSQAKALELAECPHLVLLCGHYEGIDERVRDHLVTDEISIGDYVLTGGEIAALVVLDSVARLLPGVLGNEDSLAAESFTHGLLDYPHYTRPEVFRGWAVPPVLLSGHHGQVERWRQQQSLVRTYRRRPDLLSRLALSQADERLLLDGLRTEDNPAEKPPET